MKGSLTEKIETSHGSIWNHPPLLIHTFTHSIKMGFDASIQIPVYFKNGRPYFIRNHEEVYDLSQSPKIPDEFLEFESLQGYSWKALLDSTEGYWDKGYDSSITEISIATIFPDYDIMSSDRIYRSGDFTEADVQKFKEFCDWVRGTGVDFTYILSWSESY
jgi:hypothetical protein